MSKLSGLIVQLHNKPIGTITLLPGDRSIFAFHESYINDRQRDTLSLSVKDTYGQLITRFGSSGPALLPFFSNLLPEGTLRRYLANRAGVNPVREYFLLKELGEDLPGALTIITAEERDIPGWQESDDRREEDNKALRFSLAGIQLKFSALLDEDKQGGLVVPAQGAGGSWIVKLPALQHDGLPENEFSMMRIASQIGINVPEIKLEKISDIQGLPEGLGRLNGENAFVIRRFDRSEHGAIHTEDFAQVFGQYPDKKYEKASYRSIASVLGVETNQEDVSEFIRRLVFSTLIGNADMHLKNWSLIYLDKKNARLAPAYDLLSTIAYIPDETAALKYARTKKMAELNMEELAYLANKAKLPEKLVLDTAQQTVSDFMEVWAKEKTNLALTSEMITVVETHLRKLALVRNAGGT